MLISHKFSNFRFVFFLLCLFCFLFIGHDFYNPKVGANFHSDLMMGQFTVHNTASKGLEMMVVVVVNVAICAALMFSR